MNRIVSDIIRVAVSAAGLAVCLCSHCRNNHYVTCEDCGRLICDDDACYFEDEDYPYCASCYNRNDNRYIHSYNFKPDPVFHGEGK